MKIATALLISLVTWSQGLAAQVNESQSLVLSSQVDYTSQIGRVLGMLLLVLVLIFAVVWLMKKIGVTGHANKGPLNVKACLPLSNKEKLYVIEVGEEQLLIGVSASGISALKNLESPIDDHASSKNVTSGFSKKLQEIMQTSRTEELKKAVKDTEIG